MLFYSLLMACYWKKLVGDTRSWTKDLPDCSRMLYHWAISPLSSTRLWHCLRIGQQGEKTAKGFCQEWDLNPCPLSRTRILTSTPYWGARIEPWVWRLRPLGHPDSLKNCHCAMRSFVGEAAKQKSQWSSHLGIEPRTFGLEVQRAILCANGTLVEAVKCGLSFQHSFSYGGFKPKSH